MQIRITNWLCLILEKQIQLLIIWFHKHSVNDKWIETIISQDKYIFNTGCIKNGSMWDEIRILIRSEDKD